MKMLFIKDTTTGICMHTYKHHVSTAKQHNMKYTIFYKTIVSPFIKKKKGCYLSRISHLFYTILNKRALKGVDDT